MALPPAVRPYRCRETDCELPLGGRCARLHVNPDSECDQLVRATRLIPIAPQATSEEDNPSDSPVPEYTTDDNTAPPWSGQHVQLGNLADLAVRTMPRLIAVIGPHDAGKTSLLASLFLQFANGQYGSFPYRFASSRTLLAFDQLVLRASRWKGGQDHIVGHTPKDDSSRFLHLGLRPLVSRDLQRRHIDVLLSDISGETATEWSKNAKGAAASTMTFVRHSDAILLLADAARLSGSEGRTYDSMLADLLRRVGTVVRGAPQSPGVALVFTKIDQVPELLALGACSTIPFETAPWSRLLRAGALRTAMDALARQQVALAAFSVSSFPCPTEEGQPLGIIAPLQQALLWSEQQQMISYPKWKIERDTPSFVTFGSVVKAWMEEAK